MGASIEAAEDTNSSIESSTIGLEVVRSFSCALVATLIYTQGSLGVVKAIHHFIPSAGNTDSLTYQSLESGIVIFGIGSNNQEVGQK